MHTETDRDDACRVSTTSTDFTAFLAEATNRSLKLATALADEDRPAAESRAAALERSCLKCHERFRD